MKEQIKNLARSAKERLKLCKYIRKENFDENKVESLVNYDTTFLTQTEREEFELWQKVCEIMEADCCVPNPISRLIDHNKFDALDECSKQIYVLRLAQKYNELCQKYNDEKLLSSG